MCKSKGTFNCYTKESLTVVETSTDGEDMIKVPTDNFRVAK